MEAHRSEKTAKPRGHAERPAAQTSASRGAGILFRAGLVILMASLAFAWISLRHRRGPTPVRPVAAPNVLLISVDTLGADHLGAYGAATPTPTLDRLAEEGAVFERGMETRTMAGRLGAYLQEAGEFERSVTILEAVIRDYPDYAEAYNYLGVSYARLGRVSDSLRTLRELLELDPSSASAHSNMGSSRIERAAMY